MFGVKESGAAPDAGDEGTTRVQALSLRCWTVKDSLCSQLPAGLPLNLRGVSVHLGGEGGLGPCWRWIYSLGLGLHPIRSPFGGAGH